MYSGYSLYSIIFIYKIKNLCFWNIIKLFYFYNNILGKIDLLVGKILDIHIYVLKFGAFYNKRLKIDTKSKHLDFSIITLLFNNNDETIIYYLISWRGENIVVLKISYLWTQNKKKKII